jgi:hypothetical protein
MLINPKGSKSAPVWIIVDRPLSTDKDRGYLFSGGLGYMWDKMMADAGFAQSDYCVVCRAPDTEHPHAYTNIIGELNHDKPPIIIPLEAAGQHLCDVLDAKSKDVDSAAELEKQAGSILQSDKLIYPAYVIPTYGPQTIAAQYKQRDIIVSCDLAKAKSELDYWRANGHVLQKLPERELRIDFTFDELIEILRSYHNFPLLSNDIETIYPKRGTSAKTTSVLYKIHPGYPITVGLAPSKTSGISFDLFRESEVETRILWQELNRLLKKVPQLGQNFFNFDLNFYEMLGYEINPCTCQDTLIRHHVLWPELPHKLQFLTRQYTREPYYKDDHNGWNGKDMSKLKRYNALDCCVTMEVFEAQEQEFLERPHLR